MTARVRPTLARRLVAAVTLVVAVLAASACCSGSSKAFNDSFCKSYKDSFLQSCNSTCLAKNPGKTADCTKTCETGLEKDPTFSGKCSGKLALTVTFEGGPRPLFEATSPSCGRP